VAWPVCYLCCMLAGRVCVPRRFGREVFLGPARGCNGCLVTIWHRRFASLPCDPSHRCVMSKIGRCCVRNCWQLRFAPLRAAALFAISVLDWRLAGRAFWSD